ncbi:MAG: DNA mismatch repair endonuclease MutL [Candidatus Electrothrix sp. AR4]|nr:DNA mismatch repair endonuclease MutL [Candidatus Electrothrix sp. AR4]
MSKIHVLSDHLANQIAAGEVVERPASAVKELLENSLDAGADRIDVQVEGDGTRLIRIADNGIGMDQDDVMLCLERHATSKLIEESQLAAVATLGFRGEALPSIGSVSRMTVLSRLHTADIGTRAEMRYGTLHAVHDDGCACGTIIEVRGLFGNLPARKKFLKTKRTELFHIEEVVRNQSLAYPEVVFSLQVDGRKTVALSAVDEEQRMRDVFRYQDTLLPVYAAGTGENALTVNGYLLPPETVVSARLRILVNRRPIQDRMIRQAVIEGLKGLLMKGRQPAGLLLLEISPHLVDINVHPAKREIRFRNPKEVRRFMLEAVGVAVRRYQEEMRSDLFTMSDVPALESGKIARPVSQFPYSESTSTVESTTASTSRQNDGHQDAVNHNPSSHSSEFDRSEEPALPYQAVAQQPELPSGASSRLVESSLEECLKDNSQSYPVFSHSEQLLSQFSYGGLRLIGQFLNLYLLCEHDDQLVVIDQHAAHERILYQQLRDAYEQRSIASQSLLFPVPVELEPEYADTLEEASDTVAALGVVVEFFGDTTWVIKAVPAMAGNVPPQELLIDILGRLTNHSVSALSGLAGVIPECIEHLLASMACKAAIKAGNQLKSEEMIELLRQMGESEVFSHCPHGRPVLKIFSRQDVEKWFRRS